MEYTGLTTKYRVARPLVEQERQLRLSQNARLDVDPAYELSVIRFNATFMEVVDKYYAFKGFMTTVSLAALAIVGWMVGDMVWVSVREPGRLARIIPTGIPRSVIEAERR